MTGNVYLLLKKHVPTDTLVYCFSLWEQTPFELKIAKSRKTLVGDFSCRHAQRPRITLNHDLAPYSFLITYIHEVAHLRVYLHYKNSVEPHGKEWKKVFQNIMRPLLTESVFPTQILHTLLKHMNNPMASSYSDGKLTKALREYESGNKLLTVANLKLGTIFTFHNKVYRRGEMRRTRIVCTELKTGKHYLVPADATIEETLRAS